MSFISKSGNVFTETIKTGLPRKVLDFLELHKLEFYFKYELNQFTDKSVYSLRSKPSRLKQLNSRQFKQLEKELLSLCNTTITKKQVDAAVQLDVCKKYHNADWKSRSVRKKGRKKKQMNINPEYFKGVIRKIFNDFYENVDFDIIILVSNENLDEPLHKRVVGFLVTQFAECRDVENVYSNIPALNLVCAPKKHAHTGNRTNCQNGCSVIGRILLFMYSYALKKNHFKYGILELAGLYCNIGGLCLYNKFGFREDISIKTPTCFEEEETLSMVSKIEDITYTELYDALLDNKNISVPDEEPLCKKPSTAISREKQISIQQDQVLNRMQNYENILKLQKGKLSLDDIEDIYFNNNKPSEIKNAVKSLSQLSKEGNIFRFTRKRPPSRARTAAQDTKRRRSLSAPPIAKSRDRTQSVFDNEFGFHYRKMTNPKMLNFFSNLSKKGIRLHKKRKHGGRFCQTRKKKDNDLGN